MAHASDLSPIHKNMGEYISQPHPDRDIHTFTTQDMVQQSAACLYSNNIGLQLIIILLVSEHKIYSSDSETMPKQCRFTLLRGRVGGAKSSLDLRRLSFSIMRAAANAILLLFMRYRVYRVSFIWSLRCYSRIRIPPVLVLTYSLTH